MSHHRPTARSAAALLVILAASGTAAIRSGAKPAVVPAPHATAALPDSLSFEVEYAGLGAEGVDQVWRGTVAGPVPGMVTIRVEYAGSPSDRHMPVWPVNAWLFFSATDLSSSFAAELSGSMNWGSGEMRVTGLVSDGIRQDTAVEQRIRLRRPGFAGLATVRFLPRLATHAVAAGRN